MQSQSMIAEISKEIQQRLGQHWMGVQVDDVQNTGALHAATDQMQNATHTGNHTSRNNPVRVPTRAGEPTRA